MISCNHCLDLKRSSCLNCEIDPNFQDFIFLELAYDTMNIRHLYFGFFVNEPANWKFELLTYHLQMNFEYFRWRLLKIHPTSIAASVSFLKIFYCQYRGPVLFMEETSGSQVEFVIPVLLQIWWTVSSNIIAVNKRMGKLVRTSGMTYEKCWPFSTTFFKVSNKIKIKGLRHC